MLQKGNRKIWGNGKRCRWASTKHLVEKVETSYLLREKWVQSDLGACRGSSWVETPYIEKGGVPEGSGKSVGVMPGLPHCTIISPCQNFTVFPLNQRGTKYGLRRKVCFWNRYVRQKSMDWIVNPPTSFSCWKYGSQTCPGEKSLQWQASEAP